jgi:flagellar hook-associated protein 2
MTTSITSSINLSSLGLGSGLDDSSIISQLVAIESAPLTNMQTEATSITSASTTIATFSSSLTALQTAAQALADPTQYDAYSASSSGSQVVASAASGATAGTHSVSVSQLAQAQTTYSNPQSSSTAALGMSGTLGLTIGGATVNVAVGSTDSLADVAAAISASGAAVTASVVFDGTNYRLDVQGTQTGAANAIGFSESGFTLGLPATGNAYQSAQDANATVDGISVTSATNQLSGAIPGVTLALTGTTVTPTTVTVASDSTSLATKVATFVSAYNTVITSGHTDAGYGSTAATNPLLAGDPGIESSLTQLSSLVASSVAGADSTMTTLGSAGITLNNDGTLTLDTSALAQAVQSDPTGVEKLFVTSADQGMTGIMGTLSDTIGTLATNPDSVLDGETSYFASRTTEITTQETAMQARIQAYQTQLQTAFSSADEIVNNERSMFSAVGGTGTFM